MISHEHSCKSPWIPATEFEILQIANLRSSLQPTKNFNLGNTLPSKILGAPMHCEISIIIPSTAYHIRARKHKTELLKVHAKISYKTLSVPN